jgi:hypothetical protein
MLDLLTRSTKNSKLFLYRDTEVWAKAIENLILEFTKGEEKRILLVGSSKLVSKLGVALHEVGQRPFLFSGNKKIGSYFQQAPAAGTFLDDLSKSKKMDFIVGLDPAHKIDMRFTGLVKSDTLLVDGCLGAFAKDFISWAQEKRVDMIRVDMRAAMDAEAKQKYDTHQMYSWISGKKYIKGIECVAGGHYGRKGSVVLDSISEPKCVVGLATGEGQVKYAFNKKEREILRRVEEELFG